jgi:enoyl-[acyl-carrier protein] reductase I
MTVPARWMDGKRGLVLGVANERSIAWGVARTLHAHGAELAFTFQNEALERRVRPLAESVGAREILRCDVEDTASLDAAFDALARRWGGLDFVVHSLAYSDKDELKGAYVNTSKANFIRTMEVSCFSFTSVARRARRLMAGRGGSLVTMTYHGAERVMPSYNVMGVAKAALEASVRYLAADLGPEGIRVNAISAGPMRTLAGSAISSARRIYQWSATHAPLRRTVELDELGGAALYLLSGMSAGVTGETHHVDAGYHVIGMGKPSAATED